MKTKFLRPCQNMWRTDPLERTLLLPVVVHIPLQVSELIEQLFEKLAEHLRVEAQLKGSSLCDLFGSPYLWKAWKIAVLWAARRALIIQHSPDRPGQRDEERVCVWVCVYAPSWPSTLFSEVPLS